MRGCSERRRHSASRWLLCRRRAPFCNIMFAIMAQYAVASRSLFVCKTLLLVPLINGPRSQSHLDWRVAALTDGVGESRGEEGLPFAVPVEAPVGISGFQIRCVYAG